MNDTSITLNSTWLRNRVAALGLRQWWLAEQIGVDRKTVIRWLHGHVRQVQLANATALAAVLGCRLADLALPKDAADLATVADQRAAAALLATSSLLDKLGPVGEWDVIESLLKAVAVPDLPLHVLGTLLHRLGVACWRQDKLAEAWSHNEAAFDIARRCGDNSLLAGVHASRANLLHWRGDCLQALAASRAGLLLRPFIDTLALAALHNNLGCQLCDLGEFDAGAAELLAARALYRLDGTPMQRSINDCALALLALRRGQLDVAERHAAASAADARVGDYRRGQAMAGLLAAELAARRGQAAPALAALATAKAGFGRLGIHDGVNCEMEARVLRLLGHGDAAQRAVQQGLQCAAAFPVELAWLQLEAMWTSRLLGDAAVAHGAGLDAAARFEQLGAPRQAQAVRAALQMPPHVPWPPVPAALP